MAVRSCPGAGRVAAPPATGSVLQGAAAALPHTGGGRPAQRVAGAYQPREKGSPQLQSGATSPVPTRHTQHLPQPVQMLLQTTLLQEAADLRRDVEPDLGVVSHVAHKGESLVGLQGSEGMRLQEGVQLAWGSSAPPPPQETGLPRWPSLLWQHSHLEVPALLS